MMLKLTPSLAVKLASLVVHADEGTARGAHDFDMSALRSIVDDPEVSQWLDTFGPGLLLVKRGEPR